MKRIVSTVTTLALCALAIPAFAGRAKNNGANYRDLNSPYDVQYDVKHDVKKARKGKKGKRMTVAKLHKEVQQLKAQLSQLQQQFQSQEEQVVDVEQPTQLVSEGQIVEPIDEQQPELVGTFPAEAAATATTPETYYQAPDMGYDIVQGPISGAGRLAEDAVIGAGEVVGSAARTAEDVVVGAADIATAPFRAL